MSSVYCWLLDMGVLWLALALFVVLIAVCEIGFRFGDLRRRKGPPDEHDHAMTATLTSAMVALLAFVLGLSVNYAENRFEARRDLVVAEANDISTAWLRARAIGGVEGDAIAAGIRDYAQTRLAFTRENAADPVEALNERSNQTAARIWEFATTLARKAPTPITGTLITALNEMFDAAQAQRFAFISEPPGAMLDMMFLGSMIAIGAMGYEMGLRGGRQALLSSFLLLMWTGAMVMTVDLNRPRVGLARPDPRPLEWTLHDIDAWSKGVSIPPPAANP